LIAYIVSVVRNTSITILKKRKQREQREISLDSGKMSDIASDEPPLHEIMEQFDDYAQLRLIWNELSEEDRFLLEKRYVLHTSDAYLAESLGCKPDSIRMKLSRARKNALHLINQLDKEAGV
jgi:RNA polymerase sigma factor (sigma-70 family)